MNRKEILSADLLDIVFEGRNKEYGAYDLRRGYSRRLRIAIFTTLVLAGSFLMILILRSATKKGRWIKPPLSGPLIIAAIDESTLLPELPPPPVDRRPPAAASVRETMFTSTVNIRPNHAALNSLPNQAALSTSIPSDKTRSGLIPGDLPRLPTLTRPGTVKVTAFPSEPQEAFVPDEVEAGFPGGSEALREFMASNLVTPDDLQAGEKKTVHVRFNIEADGKVSGFEIVQSAGYSYDQEVLRVCKKMPKWKPARQNGIYVKASFMLPVTFLGLEYP